MHCLLHYLLLYHTKFYTFGGNTKRRENKGHNFEDKVDTESIKDKIIENSIFKDTTGKNEKHFNQMLNVFNYSLASDNADEGIFA